MSFDPAFEMEGLASLRKPFTPTPGLSIAPYKSPHFEGSGSVFFRLSSNPTDKRVGLLTCAHVSHPPPLFENKAYDRKKPSHPREDVLILGNESFNKAVGNIMAFIGTEMSNITTWESSLNKIPEPVEGEHDRYAARRRELVNLIEGARDKIGEADRLHTYVTKNFTTTESRVIGFVLHSSKIEVGADGFMYDWSMIQLDEDKIELGDFKGNKLFVGMSLLHLLFFVPLLTDGFFSYAGGNKTKDQWEKYMFPQLNDRRGFYMPEDMLLTLKGYVTEAEMRNPQNLDFHNVKTLLAVKNGRTTNTNFGRVTGLESITREYTNHGISEKAREFIVCGYDTTTGRNDRFSDSGDSGSMVVGRDGRLIGMLTGGGGPTDVTDKTYITPYYLLKEAIGNRFPGCHLLNVGAE